MDALTSPARAPARGSRDLLAWGVAAALALFLVSQYRGAWSVAFINDDYIFLDKTRTASFLSLWKPEALAFHWYRPWSRELHYWTLQHLFGTRELPFHLASWGLALMVLLGYFAVARRLAGGAVATIAVAGVAALSAWGVPLIWIAGVQDLWMLAFAMVFLWAVMRRQRALALAALALALLSKEAAVTLPALAIAYGVLVERRSLREAVAWVWPLAIVVAAWAAFHPVLGGRLWKPIADPLEPGLHPPLAQVALRTLLVPFNLDALPKPERGWATVGWSALPGAFLLGAIAAWGSRDRAGAQAAPRALRFGAAWAVLAWTPLLLPTLGWHSYYALLGAFGAWLAIAAALSRRPVIAVVVIAVLALLRGARADTPSRDWGSEWYQRRAGDFIAVMRADLRRQVPAPEPHSRFYFVRVPSNVGFLAGDGPALRVWYADPTLRAGYYPSFRARPPEETQGADRFFRFDSTAGWVPVFPGAEDVAAARRANPRWTVDHDVLARTLAQGGAWEPAAVEYEKLAASDSLRVEFAYNAGICREALGDSARAAFWYQRAALLPGADEGIRGDAARFSKNRASSPQRRH